MPQFLVALLNWVTGGLADKLLAAYKARLADGENADRLAADLAAREIDARRQIAIAELGSWLTAAPRVTIEMTVAVYIGKVVVWDKVLGLGSTDVIGGDVGTWVGIVVTGMFGSSIASKVVGGFVGRR